MDLERTRLYKDKSLTGNNESVDGDTVVFVLFVRVRAPQSQPGQEGPEEVKEEADHDQSSCAADIAWIIERVRTPGHWWESVKIRTAGYYSPL